MQIIGLGSTFEGVWHLIASLLDIIIIWFIIYYSLKVIRTNTRTTQLFKGIFFVILVDILAKIFQLKTIQFITDMFINWGFLAIIIIFQPEIRSLLEKLGKSTFFSRFSVMSNDDKSDLVDAIVTASILLSNDQTGALITLAQSYDLENYINSGTRLDAKVSAELLTSIFVTSTPLHDGAVIIQGDRVVCASAYFPPTNRIVSSRYGSRHRTAMGISEVSDAVTIVISEETGSISVTREGSIESVSPTRLKEILQEVIFAQKKDDLHMKAKPSLSEKLIYNKQNKDDQPVEALEIHEGVQKIWSDEHKSMQQIQYNADKVAKSVGMKLPHKKIRPKASYPQQEKVKKSSFKKEDSLLMKEKKHE